MAPKPGGSTVVLALLGSGAAGTPGHRAGTECACCTCHRVPLKHPWTCLTLREVQQNLQMSSAREQCYEGLYSLFFEALVMVCLVRLLVCPGFPSPPFFSGGPCKYVQRPCSPSISSAFSCADLYNDLFKGTWIKRNKIPHPTACCFFSFLMEQTHTLSSLWDGQRMGQVWQRVWAQGGAGAALGSLEGWSSSCWPQGTKMLPLKE